MSLPQEGGRRRYRRPKAVTRRTRKPLHTRRASGTGSWNSSWILGLLARFEVAVELHHIVDLIVRECAGEGCHLAWFPVLDYVEQVFVGTLRIHQLRRLAGRAAEVPVTV